MQWILLQVTYAVGNSKPEKIQVCWDSNPNLTLISVLLVQHSNQLSRFSEIRTLISVLLFEVAYIQISCKSYLCLN